MAESAERSCEKCGRALPGASGQACPKCKAVFYCSKNCQAGHKGLHSSSCVAPEKPKPAPATTKALLPEVHASALTVSAPAPPPSKRELARQEYLDRLCAPRIDRIIHPHELASLEKLYAGMMMASKAIAAGGAGSKGAGKGFRGKSRGDMKELPLLEMRVADFHSEYKAAGMLNTIPGLSPRDRDRIDRASRYAFLSARTTRTHEYALRMPDLFMQNIGKRLPNPALLQSPSIAAWFDGEFGDAGTVRFLPRTPYGAVTTLGDDDASEKPKDKEAPKVHASTVLDKEGKPIKVTVLSDDDDDPLQFHSYSNAEYKRLNLHPGTNVVQVGFVDVSQSGTPTSTRHSTCLYLSCGPISLFHSRSSLLVALICSLAAWFTLAFFPCPPTWRRSPQRKKRS
jgi:MYND finger